MSRTLGYYVNNTIPAIADFETTYGAHLGGLSTLEKLWLVTTLAEDAMNEWNGYNTDEYGSIETIRDTVGDLRQVFLEELEIADKTALALAILENTPIKL